MKFRKNQNFGLFYAPRSRTILYTNPIRKAQNLVCCIISYYVWDRQKRDVSNWHILCIHACISAKTMSSRNLLSLYFPKICNSAAISYNDIFKY